MAARGEQGRIKEMIKVSRAAASAAAVLALGAGSATWAATSASAATVRIPVSSNVTVPSAMSGPSHVQRCTTSQLDVWVNPASANGTAGTIFYHLDFTNTSRQKCYLDGWPGVSATDWSGRRLGLPARRTADVGARTVNIRPGGTAHAVLGYVDAQISLACLPTVATYLKVYPPGSKGSKNASFPMAVCTTKTRDLTIGRVQQGG
jgi:Protein of unknown function (DUF4232)